MQSSGFLKRLQAAKKLLSSSEANTVRNMDHVHEHEAMCDIGERLMANGSLSALTKSVEKLKPLTHHYEVTVQYRNLTFWNDLPGQITYPTVGSTLAKVFYNSEKKHRVQIIGDLTGRILPKRMTLVMGPPGCGKKNYELKPEE